MDAIRDESGDKISLPEVETFELPKKKFLLKEPDNSADHDLIGANRRIN